MRSQPSASQRTDRALAANARAGSLSQASTAVHAAQLTTASGRIVVITPSTASRSVTSSAAWSAATTSSPAAVAVATTSWPSCPPAPVTTQPHQNAARALSGSHQSRWVRYHSTVRASASSRSCSVDQPSSATLSVVIE